MSSEPTVELAMNAVYYLIGFFFGWQARRYIKR